MTTKRVTRRSLTIPEAVKESPIKSVDVEDEELNSSKAGRKRKRTQLDALIEDANKNYRTSKNTSQNKEDSLKQSPVVKKTRMVNNKSKSKKQSEESKNKENKKETKKKSSKGVVNKNNRKKYVVESDEEEEEEEAEPDDESDEEYKGEEEEESDAEDVEEEEDDDEEEYDDKKSKTKNKTKKKKNPSLNTSSKTIKNNKKRTAPVLNESMKQQEQEETVKEFEIIKEWSYELDEETKFFKYPKIPNLDDSLLEAYISRKTSKDYQIYSCPYCEKLFTYSLCFKTHLYSCSKSPHCEYLYLCAYGGNDKEEEEDDDDDDDDDGHRGKKKSCNFKSNKKQAVIEHFKVKHLVIKDIDESSFHNKHSIRQIKNNYLHIDDDSYLLVKDYYEKHRMRNFKNLSVLNNFLNIKNYWRKTSELRTNKYFEDKSLEFRLGSNQYVQLNAFESYRTSNYELINLCEQILTLEWCFKNDSFQYLAISARAIKNLMKLLTNKEDNVCGSSRQEKINDEVTNEVNYENNACSEANLIYFYRVQKSEELSEENEVVNCLNSQSLFAILNRSLGDCHCLKWRSECGNVTTAENRFLGYILATSTNGYAYIYLIENLFKNENGEKNLIEIFEPTQEIRLKANYKLYGQCTSGDWCQLNGATKIALGYTSGNILLFDVDNQFYFEYLNENKVAQISPYKVINAHITFVKTLKWSKVDEYLLASGSSFSREVKVWNLKNTDRFVVDYEIFISELAFSMHTTDIFMTREGNLKGDNRLYAFDIFYDSFQSDREQSRIHSSIFFSYSSLTSLDLSDLLNKCLTCDNNGLIMLNRANDTHNWIHKNKSFLNSFAQIARFSVEIKPQRRTGDDEMTSDNLNDFNVTMDELKKKKLIKLDLKRVTTKESVKSENGFNKFNLDLNHLTKIRWNQNLDNEHQYAVGSVSGFIFIHQIEDLKYDIK